MVRALVFCVLAFKLVFASPIKISADNFSADLNSGSSKFSGNVKIERDSDVISASSLDIKLNQNKQPEFLRASGGVRIRAILSGQVYVGSADVLEYDSLNSTYTLLGQAHIAGQDGANEIYGEKISINLNSGAYSVSGDGPVKFIIDLKDK